MIAIDERAAFAPYAERELMARYECATEKQRARGRAWYDKARDACRRIADETGYTFEQVAAVLSIVSPAAHLRTDIEWTAAICRGDRPSMAGRYPSTQAPKVRAALADPEDPGQYVTGPKVSQFYRAILGDEDGLVIDRWATFAAGGSREDTPTAAQREAFGQAFRDAAAAVGESVRDFQAIVWIQARESTPHDGTGRIHDLKNITSAQLALFD